MSTDSLSSVPLSRDSSDISIHINTDMSPLLENAMKTVDLVLSTQTKAIGYLTTQYRRSEWSRTQMKKSLRIMNNALNGGGKIVLSGMGKSYKIAAKTVATLNSLSIQSALLHPGEALHGDLGIIREERNDILLLISASGNTHELINMLQYVPETVPVVLMTCSKKSLLADGGRVNSLLYAELPKRMSEKNLYGLAAPTISTTLCLTLLDAVSMAISELYMNDVSLRQKRFGDRHPGGAIGADNLKEKAAAFANLRGSSKSSGSGSRSDSSGGASSATTSSATSISLNAPATINAIIPESPIEEDEELHEDAEIREDEQGLTIANLALLSKVKDSQAKTVLRALPDNDELETLRLLIMNDYIILEEEGQQRVLDCQAAHDIIRDARSQGDAWPEVKWKLEQCLTPVLNSTQ